MNHQELPAEPYGMQLDKTASAEDYRALAQHDLGEVAVTTEVEPLTHELSPEAVELQAEDVEIETLFRSRYYSD